VIQNDMQYMDQLTKYTLNFNESLKKAYIFLEGYVKPGSSMLVYQPNFGNWYTQNHFKISKMDDTWSASHIWTTIKRREIEYVVLSEWDDFHPFSRLDEYPERYISLWSFSGSIGWKTVVYATKFSDDFPQDN